MGHNHMPSLVACASRASEVNSLLVERRLAPSARLAGIRVLAATIAQSALPASLLPGMVQKTVTIALQAKLQKRGVSIALLVFLAVLQ